MIPVWVVQTGPTFPFKEKTFLAVLLVLCVFQLSEKLKKKICKLHDIINFFSFEYKNFKFWI